MNSAFEKLKNFSLILIVASMGGFLFHFLLMISELYLFESLADEDLRRDFWTTSFSGIFLPMLISEILFVGLIIHFWNRSHRAITRAHDLAIRETQQAAQIRSSQQLMQVVAENIANHNTKIKETIEFRKQQGRPVSDKILRSSHNISIVLRAMSEISYVTPYLAQKSEEIDLVQALEDKIHELKSANIGQD